MTRKLLGIHRVIRGPTKDKLVDMANHIGRAASHDVVRARRELAFSPLSTNDVAMEVLMPFIDHRGRPVGALDCGRANRGRLHSFIQSIHQSMMRGVLRTPSCPSAPLSGPPAPPNGNDLTSSKPKKLQRPEGARPRAMGKRRGAAGLRAAGAVAVAGATLLGPRPAQGLRWRSFTTQEGARGGLDPGLESPPSRRRRNPTSAAARLAGGE